MTAFTFTVTLSLVITSCGGTSIATVRKLTRTSLSMKGMMTTTPGPLPPISPRASRPHRKITPRSYSRSTLNPIRSSTTTRNRSANGLASGPISDPLLRHPFDGQPQPFDADHLCLVPWLQGQVAHGLPQFSMYGYLTLRRERRCDGPHHAQQLL